MTDILSGAPVRPLPSTVAAALEQLSAAWSASIDTPAATLAGEAAN